MKPYLVEARLAYEVQADTADEALRLVSLMLLDHRAVSIEYSVRERPASIAPKEPQVADLHGLTKSVYTVSETASLLRTSRHAAYELVRRGLGCVRLGRRVLIPRSKIIGILNGEVSLDQQHLPARFDRRRDDMSFDRRSQRCPKLRPPFNNRDLYTNGKSPARDRGLS